MARDGEPRADCQTRHDETCHDDERDDAHCPAEPDDRNESPENDWEDDAATGAATCGKADGERSSSPEPVSENRD